MAFETFQKRVNDILSRIKGAKPKVIFRHDPESGKHYANFSDGTTIIGNTVAKKVAVKWGSGHMSTVAI